MPRGQYPRMRILTHRFSITFHDDDWPYVEEAARKRGLSIAQFVRACVFETLRRKESPRQSDLDTPKEKRKATKGHA